MLGFTRFGGKFRTEQMDWVVKPRKTALTLPEIYLVNKLPGTNFTPINPRLLETFHLSHDESCTLKSLLFTNVDSDLLSPGHRLI
jgi:hypothetical protein